jgi:TatD DNase family protein
VQRDVFRRQIRVAKKLALPIIVHSRDANDETVEILADEYASAEVFTKGQANSLELKANSYMSETSDKPSASSREFESPGIMHCFGGTPQMAKQCLELGFYISFAGNVTFKKADELRDAARVAPLDRLLVETDCPFLTPVPHRGKRNEPAMVVHTAKFLAEFYNIPFEQLAEQTTKNFLDLFRISLATEHTE